MFPDWGWRAVSTGNYCISYFRQETTSIPVVVETENLRFKFRDEAESFPKTEREDFGSGLRETIFIISITNRRAATPRRPHVTSNKHGSTRTFLYRKEEISIFDTRMNFNKRMWRRRVNKDRRCGLNDSNTFRSSQCL